MIEALELEVKRVGTGSNGRPRLTAVSTTDITRTREDLLAVLTSLENVAALPGAQATSGGISALLRKVKQNRFQLPVEGGAAQPAANGLAALEVDLDEFPVSGKNPACGSSEAGDVRKLIDDLRLAIELQIRAARMPLNELQTKRAELDEHLAAAERQREDSQKLLLSSVAFLSSLIEREAERFAAEKMGPLRASIRERLNSLAALGRKEQASQMDKFLRERIEEIFADWRTQFESAAWEHFRQTANRFAEHVNGIIAGVRRTAASLFGFSLQCFDTTAEFPELEPGGQLTGTVLDWRIGNAPLMLPSGLFRRYLLRVMAQKADVELARNAAHVAFDYRRRLNRCVALFLENVTAELKGTIGGIRRALETEITRHEERSVAVEVQLAERETVIVRLNKCQERVDRMGSEYSASQRIGGE